MKLFSRIKRKLLRVGSIAFHEPAYWLLACMSRNERARFESLSLQSSIRYNRIRTNAPPAATTSLWSQFNESLERTLLPHIPVSFLRDDVISATMVMSREGALMREQLSYLKSRFPRKVLKSILPENATGHPKIASWPYMSSHNAIHHFYHLARFTEATNASPDSLRRVIEWGGGYGNFAKIFSRLYPVTRQYIIIDTPILCTLQWLYLSSVLPDIPVQLVQSAHEPLRGTGIIIIPTQWYAQYNLSADLFISTWALSESPLETQNDIGLSRKWFDASHLLIGYQESNTLLPHAGHIEHLARASGALISELPVLKGQHYAFR